MALFILFFAPESCLAQVLYEDRSIKIQYGRGADDRFLGIPQEQSVCFDEADMQELEVLFSGQQSPLALKKIKRDAPKKLEKCFLQSLSSPVLLKLPHQSRKFLFEEVVTAQDQEGALPSIKVYGITDEPLERVFVEFLRTCILAKKSKWTFKSIAKACAITAAVAVSADAALSYTAPEETIKQELDMFIASQWDNADEALNAFRLNGQEKCIVFFAHGYFWWRAPMLRDIDFMRERSIQQLFDAQPVTCCPSIHNGRRYSSEAQKWDVYQVVAHLRRLIKKRKELNLEHLPIVCFGQSNGASTLIAVLSEYWSELKDHVVGCLLSAPYADVAELGDFKYLPRVPGRNFVARRLLKYVIAPNHDVLGMTPVQYFRDGKYPCDLKTLIFWANDDEAVPWHPNRLLFEEAIKGNSYDKAIVSNVEKGGHNPYIDDKDGWDFLKPYIQQWVAWFLRSGD